ncbi:MAG: cytochrome P450 [Acidimicrobiia bacterium]|nr:cytochrome P450 [Acidimicrobiia bacterium]MDH4306932.1 cytochrome P450 [Acidimicrobiia bacterium]
MGVHTVDVALEDLEHDPHAVIGRIREDHPVAWIPALKGWLITRRDLVRSMMRDAETFTVDDPRFSTAQVLGPSMLSLDGPEHQRHRGPFAAAFRKPEVQRDFADIVRSEARRLVRGIALNGEAELRVDLAGPLAVNTITTALELVDADPATVRGWYDDIVDAVIRTSTGQVVDDIRPASVDHLAGHVRSSIDAGASLVTAAARTLTMEEVVSNTGVMMFGGIETVEGSIANAFVHLLTRPEVLSELDADPALWTAAVEESLRLEPSVVQVDRFATRRVEVEGAIIEEGDFVMLSIAGANRDPSFYPDPDTFDLHRENARTNLTFAQGPHVCVGMHLARLEVRAALEAAFTALPGLTLTEPTPITGLVFRKPVRVPVMWSV